MTDAEAKIRDPLVDISNQVHDLGQQVAEPTEAIERKVS